MKTILDGAMPGIRCPNSNSAFTQTVSALKRAPTVTCVSCGTVTTVDLDTGEMDAAARSINDIADKPRSNGIILSRDEKRLYVTSGGAL